MSFASLGALLWLIPAVAALVALYLLKMRRKPLKVPAVFLWPKQVEEIRANSLFQKPRFNVLFWLQLAALVLIALALAGPQWLTRSLTGKVTMVVLDGSASMGATDVSPSRFDEAKRLAKQAIDELKPGDLLGVVYAGRDPKVVIPLTAEPRRHLARLEALQAEDAPSDMGASLRLAAASVGAFDGVRLLLLSDGALRDVGDFVLNKGEVVFRSIGKSARNVGISALGATATAEGTQVYCAVRNYGLDAAQAELTLTADGKTLDVKTIKVEGGATWGTTVRVPPDTRLCQAAIEADDFLKADNRRATLVMDSAKLRVLLVGPGDYFLEKALALDPRVTLERSARVPEAEKAGPGSYDLVVFAGALEEPVRARGVLAFGKPSASARPITRPEHVATADHPAVNGIEFGQVYIENIYRTTLKGAQQAVVEARQGPMLVAEQSPSRRRVQVLFDLQKSDWPLRPGFPIFVGQALSFLAGSKGGDIFTISAGSPFTIPLGQDGTFSPPDGIAFSRQPEYAIVRGLPKTGQYSFRIGQETKTYYANLEDTEEPKIDPAPSLSLGGQRVGQTPVPERPTDLWKWAALAVLGVLAIEWWAFVRKS